MTAAMLLRDHFEGLARLVLLRHKLFPPAQPAEADVLRKRREPIFGRPGFALGPLDEQPLLQ
jgi:hypothetical protein